MSQLTILFLLQIIAVIVVYLYVKYTDKQSE